MVSKSTNTALRTLITKLENLSKERKIDLWSAVAKNLSRSKRLRRQVNLSKINKYTNDNEIALIPGKVLGSGEIKKKIQIAALAFSESSKEKVKDIMSIEELMLKNPQGKNVRIIG